MDVYYDITNLIAYLSRHGRVTGIQRVETRLLAELARTPHAAHAWCVAIDASGRGYRAWRLADVVPNGAWDDVRSLLRLVEEPGRGRWPSRLAVRRHLNRVDAKGWRRTCMKVGLYSQAWIASARFNQNGLISGVEMPPAPSAMHLARLPHGATLVLLGGGWNEPAMSVAIDLHVRQGGRVVHLIHDLIPLVCPDYFTEKACRAFARYLNEVADRAAEFMCVSRNTQDDLETFLERRGIRARSTVVPLAHEFAGYPRNARDCRPHDQRLLTFGDPGREFFLCVGTLEIRKNGLALLDAWLRLRSELGNVTPHLIFCGRRGWKNDPFFRRLAEHPWLRERVHLVHGADDADLAFLHERSLASVYPSLYEGWGLPVGEAAWFGRLCITSREASLPEVCGALAEYVDPRNPAEIAVAVRRATVDRQWRERRERLIAEASLRTWHDAASDLLEVVAGSGRLRHAA